MKLPRFITMFFRPQVMREVAAQRSEFAAVGVNAVSGMLILTGLLIPRLALFTPSLVALLIILFGPFFGFVISSTYMRLEWAVGKNLQRYYRLVS